MRKCPTPLRVRGLTITGIGHPPAECGIKTKDQKRRHYWDSSFFSQTHLLSVMAEGFYFKKWYIAICNRPIQWEFRLPGRKKGLYEPEHMENAQRVA